MSSNNNPHWNNSPSDRRHSLKESSQKKIYPNKPMVNDYSYYTFNDTPSINTPYYANSTPQEQNTVDNQQSNQQYYPNTSYDPQSQSPNPYYSTHNYQPINYSIPSNTVNSALIDNNSPSKLLPYCEYIK